jgi:type I restriction enzyme M protein
VGGDKINLDIFWLGDYSLGESPNLPDPETLAREIIEELEAALAQFASISVELGRDNEYHPHYQAL